MRASQISLSRHTDSASRTSGGVGRIRTADQSVADSCLTTWLRRRTRLCGRILSRATVRAAAEIRRAELSTTRRLACASALRRPRETEVKCVYRVCWRGRRVGPIGRQGGRTPTFVLDLPVMVTETAVLLLQQHDLSTRFAFPARVYESRVIGAADAVVGT